MSTDFNTPGNWTLVQGSTNISAIQYIAGDPAADFGTLRIRFTSGAEYSYDKVPNQLAVDFFESESKGKFFHANIRQAFEGVRSGQLKKADDGLDGLEEALDKALPPLPEDIPISELFDNAEPIPTPPEEPILPKTYRERA